MDENKANSSIFVKFVSRRHFCGKSQRRFLLAIIILICIVLLDVWYIKQNFFPTTFGVVPILPLCRNVLDAMQNGSWVKKPHLTKEDYQQRDKMDIFLRRHRGQPVNLNRSDLRCGTKYLISSPGFEAKIPASCMRNSNRHCCNARGLCSNGKDNCACAECTDFRKILHAELHDWKPVSCQMRNYSSVVSCAMVGERLDNLVLIGDSLMRHFFAALMLIFTGDSQAGALLEDRRLSVHCTGERQFVDRGRANCHTIIAKHSHDKRKHFCQGKSQFSLVFKEYYNLDYSNKTLHLVQENLDRTNSLFIIGIGLHDRLNSRRINEELLDPILTLIGSRKWPRLVWVTVHAQGFLKPPMYRGVQNNERISQYNEVMSNKLRQKGIDVFDVFPITKGVHSYDGTHYGYGMNMIKAQCLLNYIHQTIQPKTPWR